MRFVVKLEGLLFETDPLVPIHTETTAQADSLPLEETGRDVQTPVSDFSLLDIALSVAHRGRRATKELMKGSGSSVDSNDKISSLESGDTAH